MTDRTPMQRALDRDTQIEDLAREVGELLTVLELIGVDLTAGNMSAKTRVALALDRVRAAIAGKETK